MEWLLETIQNFKIVGSIKTLFQGWMRQIEIKVLDGNKMVHIQLKKVNK